MSEVVEDSECEVDFVEEGEAKFTIWRRLQISVHHYGTWKALSERLRVTVDHCSTLGSEIGSCLVTKRAIQRRRSTKQPYYLWNQTAGLWMAD